MICNGSYDIQNPRSHNKIPVSFSDPVSCDNDGDCPQDYLCGDNNCDDFSSDAYATADCCVPGMNLIIIGPQTQL